MPARDESGSRWTRGLSLCLVVGLGVELGVARLALRGRDAYALAVGRPGAWPAVVGAAFALAALAYVRGVFVGTRPAMASGERATRDRALLVRGSSLVALVYVGVRLALSPSGGALLGLDGYGTYERLRELAPTIPVVVAQCAGVVALGLHAVEIAEARALRTGDRRLVPAALLLAIVYAALALDGLAGLVIGRPFLEGTPPPAHLTTLANSATLRGA